MTLMSYIEALLDQWQRGMRTPDDVIREIRKAAIEEREIEAAEAREVTVAPTEATSATVHLTMELAIPEEIRVIGSGEVWAKQQANELLEAILAIWEVVGDTTGAGFSVGKVGLDSWVKREDREYLRVRLDEAIAREDEADIRRFSDLLDRAEGFEV